MKPNLKAQHFLMVSATMLFILVLLNLTTLIIIALMFYKQMPLSVSDSDIKKGLNAVSFNNPFSGCQLLNDSCFGRECPYSYMCDDFKNLKNCSVYDCGKNYGIVVKTEKDDIVTREYPKPDPKEVYALVDRCRGKLDIVSKKCVGGKYEIDIKVSTKGECKIQNFLVDSGNKNYAAAAFEQTNGLYHLSLDSCNNFSEIIAVGEGGVSIK